MRAMVSNTNRSKFSGSSRKLFFNFAVPRVLTLERYFESKMGHGKKFLPGIGDLVSVYYYELVSGRYSVFRIYGCYGLCIARRRSGITSHFTIRNSFKRNSLELRFFLHSPLIARIVSFDTKRRRYLRAKLYYLRLKKIAKSRFRTSIYRRI